MSAISYVYFVNIASEQDSSCYKIGQSSNPMSRIGTLQVGCPYPLKVVHQIETLRPQWIESLMHERFCDQRVRGEWFNLSEQDLSEIRKVDKANSMNDLPLCLRPTTERFFVDAVFLADDYEAFLMACEAKGIKPVDGFKLAVRDVSRIWLNESTLGGETHPKSVPDFDGLAIEDCPMTPRRSPKPLVSDADILAMKVQCGLKEKMILTDLEASEIAGCEYEFFRNELRKGHLPHLRFSKRPRKGSYRISADSFAKWMIEQMITAATRPPRFEHGECG